MNKFSKLFAGLAVLGLATSCSSDEPAVGGQDTPLGDRAYVNIFIGDVNGTRSTTEGGFVNGSDEGVSKNESKVSHIRFVFYDAAGNYIFDEDTNDQIFEEQTTGGNVEFVGKNVILVLDGLKGTDYPNYMITILNNKDFDPAGMTMDACSKALQASAAFGKADDFVMSTSSYYANNAAEGVKYYANALSANNFKTSAAEAQSANNEDVVKIYVERLAAKVDLNIDITEGVKTIGGVKYYPLEVTLVGGENEGNGNDQLYEKVYLAVEGWNLNATAVDSYLSKQLNYNWLATAPQTGWNWNDAANFRSYWGLSTVYGTTVGTNNQNSKLTYIPNSAASAVKLRNVAYCYENTNDVDNVFDKVKGVTGAKAVNTPNVTHAVLRTKLVTINDKDEVTELDFVNYRGLLYKETSFFAMLLNNIKSYNKYYTLEGSVTTETATDNDYKQFGSVDMLEIVKGADGKLTAQFKANAFTDVTLYTKGTDGKWAPAAGAEADLKSRLANEVNGKSIQRHTGGATDYYIPVEHRALTADKDNQLEGYYGVVRNHWYKITVNSINKVGHAVFEPESDTEHIVPEGPEDPLYYVGAKINILAWKIVNQSTDL